MTDFIWIFTNFPTNIHFLFWELVQNPTLHLLVILPSSPGPLCDGFCLSVSLLTSTLYRFFLSLDLPDVFWCLDCGSIFSARTPQSPWALSSVSPQGLTSGHVYLEPCLRECLLGSSTVELQCAPVSMINTLGEVLWDYANIYFLLRLLPANLSICAD